jgi:hypothetical protein
MSRASKSAKRPVNKATMCEPQEEFIEPGVHWGPDDTDEQIVTSADRYWSLPERDFDEFPGVSWPFTAAGTSSAG